MPVPWRAEDEVRQLQSAILGIMPVPDTPFARGKCGFKIIQYFAVGIPAVASDVGENRFIVSDGRNGYLIQDVADWVPICYLSFFETSKMFTKDFW